MNNIQENNPYIKEIISAIDLLNDWQQQKELAYEEHDEWEKGAFVISDHNCQEEAHLENKIINLIEKAKELGISEQELKTAGVPAEYL